MIDIRPSNNAKSVKAYLKKDEPNLHVGFGGKSFGHLGVDPSRMTLQKFDKLIDNRTLSGEKLTSRDGHNRICGFYVTMSVPKPMSLAVHFSGKGEQIREKIRLASDRAMIHFLEPRAHVRHSDKRQPNVHTGNLLWAKIHHTLSRPEKGWAMPQEHIHFFVCNASFHEGHPKGPRFLALNVRPLFDSINSANRAFHQQLRIGLHEIGMNTIGYGKRWTIEGIGKDLIDRYSPRRDAAISNHMKGVPRNLAALHGRAPKQQNIDMGELRGHWDSLLSEKERRKLYAVGKLYAAPRMDFVRHMERMNEPRMSVEVRRGTEIER